jgi:hypothetical protein
MVPYAVPMSGSGQPFSYSVLVPAPPSVAMQSLLGLPQGGNYFDGYEVRQVTGNSLHVTRRFVPVWAIIIAILGVWFFLLGLLALLVRETEVVTITVYGQDEGSYLDFSGVASPQVTRAVNLAIDRLLNGVAMAPPPASLGHPDAAIMVSPPISPAQVPAGPAQAPVSPDRKVCPECAEAVRAAARSCRFCGYRFSEPA